MTKGKKRMAHLLMVVACFICSLYYYMPGVVFYYDQEISQGKITQINERRVYVDYYHENLGKDVSVSFREGNKLHLKKLDIGKEIRLKYSKKFPSEISIINYHSSPGLGGLVMIIMFLIPLLFFRWLEFD